jgi:hypothetical protein
MRANNIQNDKLEIQRTVLRWEFRFEDIVVQVKMQVDRPMTGKHVEILFHEIYVTTNKGRESNQLSPDVFINKLHAFIVADASSDASWDMAKGRAREILSYIYKWLQNDGIESPFVNHGD